MNSGKSLTINYFDFSGKILGVALRVVEEIEAKQGRDRSDKYP
jgi:hypothetical protein